MKRLLVIALITLPLFGQRLASDFEIAQMERQLASARGFEAQLSARLNLGDARSARSERSLARNEYAKALDLAAKERLDARRESSMTRYAIATSYAALAQAKLGRDSEAFALIEEALRYTSDDPETWNLYASAMRIMDRPRKAVSAARNAVAIANPEKPLDVAVYQHALASMLIEANELDEAERLLVALTGTLRSSRFEALRREVARGEAFEVQSSARGDVAAYVSLLNRAQLRLASLYERRGAAAKAREQYQRVLEGRSDDATALAGLARLSASESERDRHYAEAFDANPFSLTLVREYQRYARERRPAVADDTTGARVRKAIVHLAYGERRAARTILDALLAQFPANETLRTLRREAEQQPAAIPSAEPSPAELRTLLEGFEQLTPDQRLALDEKTFTSVVRFKDGVAYEGTIGDVPFRFASEMVFSGAFDFTQPLELTYRIAGVANDSLFLEPLQIAPSSSLSPPRGERAGVRGDAFFPARAQREQVSASAVLADTPRGIVVAVGGRIQPWNVPGVANPTKIVASGDRVVVLDALNDEAALVENGRSTVIRTAATPVAAAFMGRDLYILCRDGNVLQHVGGESIPVAPDSAFLDVKDGALYVYSRVSGKVQRIGGSTTQGLPFASDFEAGYLVYPRESRIRTIDGAVFDVGAVPVDLAAAGGGTALTARILAVADPSAKRVWLTEGKQSTAKAIARGFLRGFIGLGLYGGRSTEFPTGVDRVLARGSRLVAYDSSSGTLYRVTKKKSSVLAKDVAPNAFALTADGVAIWQSGRIVHLR